METLMDRLLTLAAQFFAMSQILEELMQGSSQILGIFRVDQEPAAGGFDQLGE
jgi:hypothetical protein